MTKINKEGWEIKKLGEVAYYPNQRIAISNLEINEYVGVEHLLKNRAGIQRSTELPPVDNAIEFQIGDVLIGNIRPYLKKIWLADFNGGASGDVVIVRPMSNEVFPRFLYHALASDSFFEYDNLNTKGAKMPRGDRKAIAKYEIPLPPLPIQQRIVEELDEINAIISAKKQQLSKLDELAQSIFYTMFGDSVANDKGWEVKKLGEIAQLKAGKAIKASELQPQGEGLYPCYGGNGIRGYISKKSHEGDFPLIGRQGALCGNVNFAHGEFYATEHAVVVSPILQYTPTWMVFNLQGLNLPSYAGGAAQPGIAVGNIIGIESPLPPLPLQETFAARVSAIEEQKSSIAAGIEKMQTLLDARMQEYFG